jgi:WD40 repeat protein
MRQHTIEMNWRIKPIRPPKVLKGHDDHVITCLQFSGNRIVSGSDDNTLKVWSATTGKVLCYAVNSRSKSGSRITGLTSALNYIHIQSQKNGTFLFCMEILCEVF